MEQEKIIYENTLLNLQISEYKSYPFKSLGNVIHWLKAYGILEYDRITIGNYQVDLFGKLVATFYFDENKEMPIFNFTEKWSWLDKKQKNYLENKINYEKI